MEQQQPSGVSLLVTCAVSAAFSAFSGVVAWHFASQSAPLPAVAVVDTKVILEARMNELLKAGGNDAGAGSKAAEEVLEKLHSAIATYRDRGYVVLNGAAVLDTPNALDVTRDVASMVGVKLP